MMVFHASELISSKLDDGFVWKFEPSVKTWLQTDSCEDGKTKWYLANSQDNDPAYYLELPQSRPQDVFAAISQAAGKPWSDNTQLFEAVLPVIRAMAGWN